ncbi:hypothetical protein, partial [Fischerella thermalis]|uniref:hypothetical protein n=1 Tax=Fischerella thermalis TaxID=372787 RepID=UPI001CA5A87A
NFCNGFWEFLLTSKHKSMFLLYIYSLMLGDVIAAWVTTTSIVLTDIKYIVIETTTSFSIQHQLL